MERLLSFQTLVLTVPSPIARKLSEDVSGITGLNRQEPIGALAANAYMHGFVRIIGRTGRSRYSAGRSN
jgi:hypothetical protein